MNYETYETTTGIRRVNIGEHSYALEVPIGATNQTNVASEYENGIENYGNEELNAWLTAAREVGVPLRFSWSGISNALAHYGRVAPPWQPRARDHARKQAA